ncbi:MAG: transposase, partial [Candidatus Obscuribacterales bacterium]|nr:transposase [Candidatus Obscuribacterales bacterium]
DDKRFQARVDHKRNDIILQRVIQIGAGFPDGNDCDWLAGDEAVLLGLDRNPKEGKPGASQETTSRFESNAIDEKNQDDVNNIFVDHYIARERCRNPTP